MIELGILSVFLFVLGIGGFVADYIFPHIKPLARYIDHLPMWEDCEEEISEKADILLKEEAS